MTSRAAPNRAARRAKPGRPKVTARHVTGIDFAGDHWIVVREPHEVVAAALVEEPWPTFTLEEGGEPATVQSSLVRACRSVVITDSEG